MVFSPAYLAIFSTQLLEYSIENTYLVPVDSVLINTFLLKTKGKICIQTMNEKLGQGHIARIKHISKVLIFQTSKAIADCMFDCQEP